MSHCITKTCYFNICMKYAKHFHIWYEEKQIEIANNRFLRTMSINYEEILKCYEGVTEEHANTSFEFGIQNDVYYQLFYSYTEETDS